MNSEKRKILVVEDEPDIVDLIRSVLMDEGYQVSSASNGEEGLKILEKEKPHLILLDMNMPRMGGIGFYHEIYDKKTERPTYPVLVVTGRADLEKLFRDLNVDGFMTKPFEIDDLLREVRVILSKRYKDVMPPGVRFGDQQRKVLVVDSDRNTSGHIAVEFLDAGFIVNSANDAMKAFERALLDHPDLVVIRVDLPDMPGDILACKFRQMPRMMDIPLVLYASNPDTVDRAMTEQICQKAGISNFLTSADPKTIVKEALRLFEKKG